MTDKFFALYWVMLVWMVEVSPFLVTYLMTSLIFPLFRKHSYTSTLPITLEMVKKQLLHFPLYLFTENTFRGKHRKWHFQDPKFKIFWGSRLPGPLDWSTFGSLLPVRTPLKSHATPLVLQIKSSYSMKQYSLRGFISKVTGHRSEY